MQGVGFTNSSRPEKSMISKPEEAWGFGLLPYV